MKKFRHLRKDLGEELQFKVDVEGMPPTFMNGKSSAEILAKLRKIVKQPSMIKSVERYTTHDVKKAYRNKAQGREMDEATELDEAKYSWNDVNTALTKANYMRGNPAHIDRVAKHFDYKSGNDKKFSHDDVKKNLSKAGIDAARHHDVMKHMKEAVTYHGNPNKDDDARNAARRKRLAKQDNIMKKRAQDNEKARQALKDPSHNPAWANSKSKMEAKVNEISQDLKKRYIDKAKSDYGHQQFSADIAREMGAKDSEKYYRRKQRNRMAGITKASK